MLERLTSIEQRFSAIEQEMAAAGEDYRRVAQLAQERSELEPIVSAYREYRALHDQLAQIEVFTSRPGVLEDVRQQDVLSRADGIDVLQANQPQQRRHRAGNHLS
jgi:protein subunit release factor A